MDETLLEELQNSLNESLKDLTPSQAFAMGWRTAEDSFLMVWDEFVNAKDEAEAFDDFKEFMGLVRELRGGDSA